ncbi:MAG: hypothetical protein ABW352_18445 [Polyangiales bacterium]
MRWLLLSLLLVTSSATAQDRAQTSGLGVGIGAGFENAGLGGHALYYLQTRNERWRVAPHLGVGYFGKAGVSGGVMALFGRRHRLVLDVLVSPAAGEGGSHRATTLYYGLSLLAGWEWMSMQGWALRSTIGVAYRPKLDDEALFVAVNPLSLTYKFW